MKLQVLILEKNAQLAAKKISKEYKKIREANAKKKDNRALQQLIDDDFIPIEKNNKNVKQIIDDRTYQQLKDDGFIALESNEDIEPITHVRKKKKKNYKRLKPIMKLRNWQQIKARPWLQIKF